MRKEPKPSPTESPLLFEIDPVLLAETLTSLGGIPLVVQAFCSLGLPQSVKNHVRVKERERGDEDATIIESRKREAKRPYEGERGYQPMLAVWAETGLVLADEFRDGNVPAMITPLNVAPAAFAALPGMVREYYYRGDSACHESGLVNWLRNEQGEGGPLGRIGFVISARMSEALHAAIQAVPEGEWQGYDDPPGEEIRACADVPFVPGEKAEKKDTQPLRYLAIRIRKPQGELFDDGSRVRVEQVGVAGGRLDRLAPREGGYP